MKEDINITVKRYLDDLSKNESVISSSIPELLEFYMQSDVLTEELRFLLCLNLGKAYCEIGPSQDLSLAEKFLIKTEIDFVTKVKKGYEDHIYFNFGHLYARKNQFEKSKKAFLKYIYYAHKDDSNLNEDTKDFEIVRFESHFYSFRPVNKYLLTDLINSEITLASPSEFNDPFDPLLFKFLEFRYKKILENSDYNIVSLHQAYEHIKIRCFVQDKKVEDKILFAYKNNLMWAHYADSYKGVCIMYRVASEIRKSQVLEKEFCTWINAKYEEELKFEDKGSADRELLFATKNKYWDYENEVRLLHLNSECEKKHIQIPLSKISCHIDAVFFGIRCTEDDIKTIKSILGNSVNYFEFNKEIRPNVVLDDLELLHPQKFDDLIKKQTIIHCKVR